MAGPVRRQSRSSRTCSLTSGAGSGARRRRRSCRTSSRTRRSTSSRRSGSRRVAASCGRRRCLDYEWQLTHHLLPFFAGHRLSQITIAEVDRYRHAQVREAERRRAALAAWQKRCDTLPDRAPRPRHPGPALSATSINKTITRLGQILEQAVEYELIARNPARIGKRKLKTSRARRAYLDDAELIVALLDAAAELDREAREDRSHVARRTLLATLAFSGLRIGELLDLRWRDVDLAGGRLHVLDSKTDAGVRDVTLLPVLRDELATHRAAEPLHGRRRVRLRDARRRPVRRQPLAHPSPRQGDRARQRTPGRGGPDAVT